MKRFLTMCALALALLAAVEQQASAWTKSNFSIGLNFSRESADNSLAHGYLYRNGPHPFAQGGGGYSHGGDYGYGGDFHAGEPMPYASMPVQQMQPAPRSFPMQNQGVAPAAYWTPAYYYWMGQ